jgi:hypothetical protein
VQPEHIKSFTLKPISTSPNLNHRIHSLTFGDLDFDPQSRSVFRRKKMINNIKPFLAGWVINATDVHQKSKRPENFRNLRNWQNIFFGNFKDVITEGMRKLYKTLSENVPQRVFHSSSFVVIGIYPICPSKDVFG